MCYLCDIAVAARGLEHARIDEGTVEAYTEQKVRENKRGGRMRMEKRTKGVRGRETGRGGEGGGEGRKGGGGGTSKRKTLLVIPICPHSAVHLTHEGNYDM
jgi:hypothetical protein